VSPNILHVICEVVSFVNLLDSTSLICIECGIVSVCVCTCTGAVVDSAIDRAIAVIILQSY
jgi:hypothetical protein